MDVWDNDYLNLIEPAHLPFEGHRLARGSCLWTAMGSLPRACQDPSPARCNRAALNFDRWWPGGRGGCAYQNLTLHSPRFLDAERTCRKVRLTASAPGETLVNGLPQGRGVSCSRRCGRGLSFLMMVLAKLSFLTRWCGRI